MKNPSLRWIIGALAVLLITMSATAFTVRHQHVGLVTRFGKPTREAEPGLHFKLPWPVEKVVTLDDRQRVFETRHSEMLTRDKKNVVLLSYAVWEIADPLTFYRAVGSRAGADEKLDGLVTNAKIGVLGNYDLSALVSTVPETLKVDQIERELLEAVAATARENYGIEVVHVGFKRLSLPEQNIASVFDQMRAERMKEAAKWRAEGEREAKKIRSQTDLEVAQITAEAEEKAARIRGDAEAEAASIYGAAHSADPEFYRWLRELQSLPEVLSSETTLILRTDSAPFRLLEDPDAGVNDDGDDTSSDG